LYIFHKFTFSFFIRYVSESAGAAAVKRRSSFFRVFFSFRLSPDVKMNFFFVFYHLFLFHFHNFTFFVKNMHLPHRLFLDKKRVMYYNIIG